MFLKLKSRQASSSFLVWICRGSCSFRRAISLPFCKAYGSKFGCSVERKRMAFIWDVHNQQVNSLWKSNSQIQISKLNQSVVLTLEVGHLFVLLLLHLGHVWFTGDHIQTGDVNLMDARCRGRDLRRVQVKKKRSLDSNEFRMIRIGSIGWEFQSEINDSNHLNNLNDFKLSNEPNPHSGWFLSRCSALCCSYTGFPLESGPAMELQRSRFFHWRLSGIAAVCNCRMPHPLALLHRPARPTRERRFSFWDFSGWTFSIHTLHQLNWSSFLADYLIYTLLLFTFDCSFANCFKSSLPLFFTKACNL